MTKNNNSIFNLVIILAILLGLIAGIYSYNYNLESNANNAINNNNNNQINNRSINSQNEILIFNSKVSKNTKRTIVDNKFVAKLDKNSNIVVMGEDGSIYSVKKGAVLVSGVVIDAKDDSYSVYNIKSPEKSVSTN